MNHSPAASVSLASLIQIHHTSNSDFFRKNTAALQHRLSMSHVGDLRSSRRVLANSAIGYRTAANE